MDEINFIGNDIIDGYKTELLTILNGDQSLLETLDKVFLLPLGIDPASDTINGDFVEGFCEALFMLDKIKTRKDAERLCEIINSTRALHRIM